MKRPDRVSGEVITQEDLDTQVEQTYAGSSAPAAMAPHGGTGEGDPVGAWTGRWCCEAEFDSEYHYAEAQALGTHLAFDSWGWGDSKACQLPNGRGFSTLQVCDFATMTRPAGAQHDRLESGKLGDDVGAEVPF